MMQILILLLPHLPQLSSCCATAMALHNYHSSNCKLLLIALPQPHFFVAPPQLLLLLAATSCPLATSSAQGAIALTTTSTIGVGAIASITTQNVFCYQAAPAPPSPLPKLLLVQLLLLLPPQESYFLVLALLLAATCPSSYHYHCQYHYHHDIYLCYSCSSSCSHRAAPLLLPQHSYDCYLLPTTSSTTGFAACCLLPATMLPQRIADRYNHIYYLIHDNDTSTRQSQPWQAG